MEGLQQEEIDKREESMPKFESDEENNQDKNSKNYVKRLTYYLVDKKI